MVDESAKIDLNVSPPDLLIGLMQPSGSISTGPASSPARSATCATGRPAERRGRRRGSAVRRSPKLPYGAKDRPFESLSELRLVLGMDAALFEKLRPHLTVYSGLARPNPTFAGQPVLQALGLTRTSSR